MIMKKSEAKEIKKSVVEQLVTFAIGIILIAPFFFSDPSQKDAPLSQMYMSGLSRIQLHLLQKSAFAEQLFGKKTRRIIDAEVYLSGLSVAAKVTTKDREGYIEVTACYFSRDNYIEMIGDDYFKSLEQYLLYSHEKGYGGKPEAVFEGRTILIQSGDFSAPHFQGNYHISQYIGEPGRRCRFLPKGFDQ